MKDRFVNSSVLFISKYSKYDDMGIDKLKYGLESLYMSITKLLVISIIAFILGIFKEFLITLLLFNIIRFFGFGFHAGNSTICLLFSSVLFVGITFLLAKIDFSSYFLLLLEIISSLVLLIYAPADTVKRPLPNKRKRKIRKISTVIISILYIVLTIFIKAPFSNFLCSALILEAIMVSPLTYKIFNQPYRNYLNYKKA